MRMAFREKPLAEKTPIESVKRLGLSLSLGKAKVASSIPTQVLSFPKERARAYSTEKDIHT